MKPEFAAHTPRDTKNSNSPWHDLDEHLEQVAVMAQTFASKFGGIFAEIQDKDRQKITYQAFGDVYKLVHSN